MEILKISLSERGCSHLHPKHTVPLAASARETAPALAPWVPNTQPSQGMDGEHPIFLGRKISFSINIELLHREIGVLWMA